MKSPSFFLVSHFILLPTQALSDTAPCYTQNHVPCYAHFHPAQTEAERALDALLWRSDNDQNLVDYAFDFPGRLKTFDGIYAKFITKRLAFSVSAFEKRLLQENCGGKYLDAEICGFDANPFTCGQDVGDHIYRTQKQTSRKAIILAQWVGQDPRYSAATYRLVKRGHDWLLDGVTCGGNISFN